MSKKKIPGPLDRDTLLGDWLRICIKYIGGFFLCFMGLITCVNTCYKPTKTPSKRYGWSNWDPSIPPSKISHLNYETGEVEYIPEGPAYQLQIEKSNSLDDIIKEHVLENIDTEELWDRMSDEGYLVE